MQKLRIDFSANKFLIYLPFALLFGLIPYRLCGIFQMDYNYRLYLGLFFFVLFLCTMGELVILLLNSIAVQLLFYYLLLFENFVLGMRPFYLYSFLVSFFFCLGGGPSLTADSMFWYILILFLYSFYRQMRHIFVNPQFENSSYVSSHIKKVEDLTWDLIIQNMSTICLSLFGQPVQNQLGKPMTQRSFNQISKRYVWGRIYGFAKAHPEAVTFVSTIASATGVTWGLYNQKTAEQNAVFRHKEQMDFEKLRHKEVMDLERDKLAFEINKLKLGGAKVKDLSSKEDFYRIIVDEPFFFL